MESLAEFQARTGAFLRDSLPRGEDLTTNEKLTLKVEASGVMKPFRGNTVVFPLEGEVLEQIVLKQELLYQECGPVLAEPLIKGSFHITLHDLVNGEDSHELRRRLAKTEDKATERVRRLAKRRETIRLRSTSLVNMVGTSLVLCFEPEGEEDCHRLMECYDALQEIVYLPYPLTPHVTLAYYKPGSIDAKQIDRIWKVMKFVDRQEKIEVELHTERLEYQMFSDMNHYWRV